MATTLSRNLKLRIDSNLTANAKYNLERIDLLGSTFLVDTTDSLNIRSKTDINIEPESPDLDGSGVGGVVNFGNTSHELSTINLYSSAVNLSDRVGLLDAGASGTKYLRIGYNSTLNGSVDTTADRLLTIDMEGADRQLILAGNLSLLGGNLQLTSQNASSAYLLPAGASGTLATTANVEVFTNKTFDADLNTLTNVRNANVAANAGIDYSKLNLALSIVNADVAVGAAIVYSKLSLANSILNNDINSAAGIAYSKLNLSGSIVNADINASAAIGYAKLNLTNSIQGSDLNSGIVIPGANVTPDFGAQNIITSGQLRLKNGSNYTALQANGSLATNIVYSLPATAPAGVLSNDGSGNLSWISVGGTGTVTSVDATVPSEFAVAGVPITSSGTIAITKANQSANTVWSGPTSGGAAQPAFRALVAADIPVSSLNHNLLLNYVANEHIDHTSVSIGTSATSGLAGGGNISSTRALSVSPTSATLKATPIAADEVLIADSAASNALKKATLGSIISAVGGGAFAEDWTSGTTHTTTHSLGSRDVMVQLYDNTSFETIEVDSVVRTDSNTVDFTASSAPTGAGWRILIRKVS